MTSTSKSSENFFRVWGPGALQLQEPLHGVRQGPLAQPPVVPRADVHRAPALLSRANHKLKIVVGGLSPADSPAEGQSAVSVQVSGQPCSLQALLCLGQRFGDRNLI